MYLSNFFMKLNYLLRGLCLFVYASALLSLFDFLPDIQIGFAIYPSIFLLIVHAVELLLFLKHVRSYEGALWVSFALTLLFGLLHWKPLAQKKSRISDQE